MGTAVQWQEYDSSKKNYLRFEPLIILNNEQNNNEKILKGFM